MVFYKKHMIEDLEAKLSGAPEETSNTDNSEVDEEENVDEAITAEDKSINDMDNYLKEEQKTKYYKEKMNIDIENINVIENRNKVYIKQ